MPVISPAIADTAREFGAWWLSELRSLLPSGKGADRRATTLPVFTRQANGWCLLLPDGKGLGEAAISDWSAEHKLPVAIRIGSDDRLQRTLSLPVASRSKLLAMARLDLERSTPLRSGDIFDELLVESYDRTARQVKVRHIVAGRERVEKYREKARELGLEVAALSINAERDDPPSKFSTASPGGELIQARTSPQRLAVTLWTGCAALALAALGLQIFHGVREIERLNGAVEAQKDKAKVVMAVVEVVNSDTNRNNMPAGELSGYSPVVLALDELTKVLPDAASVNSLKVKPGGIEFTGLAPSAAAIVRVIERAASFDRPVITSPVTRNVRLQMEQFTLFLHRP